MGASHSFYILGDSFQLDVVEGVYLVKDGIVLLLAAFLDGIGEQKLVDFLLIFLAGLELGLKATQLRLLGFPAQ